MSQAQMIGWTLDNRPLDDEPGTHFRYSNFGYCLLGRVIEKVTGMRYEDWVRKNILDQCGIADMQIGGNTLAERLPREVHYYERHDDPYLWFARNMDAFAGWVATPADLVKFIVRVDKFPQKPDMMVNTRTGGNFQNDLDQLMWRIGLAISHWPDGEIQ